ncbi:hypothetical protein C7374_11439 [Falsochrobactrum ovis]|uniref:Uncharacterized protein n=1 Tax=Falsochrobactrum ovis TaxID=1293442 RepID=A0A364JSS0_9HYPH|nr:hypothetical protein C7374_11439 [Falsochrobactrum ovis]
MPRETKSVEYLCQIIHEKFPETKNTKLTFVPANLPSGRRWFLQIGYLPSDIHSKVMSLSEELAWEFDLEDSSGNQTP